MKAIRSSLACAGVAQAALLWAVPAGAQQSTAPDTSGKPVLSTGTAPASDNTSSAAPQAAAPPSAPAGREAQDNLLSKDIIVTAEKREERLQDVPISVTVLGSGQLAALKIASGTEIARQTPSLRVSNLGNEDQPKFSLRGISTPDFDLNTTSPTGVFYDEVFVASQFLGGPQIYDLERVEVLRGPQGTLFGKNTTAGAINFITQRPKFENSGNVEAEVGDNSFFHATGALNAQLIDDKLAARVAFSVSKSNGYVKNLNPDGRDLSSIDNYAIRGSLLWKPDDSFDALLRVSRSRSNPTNIGVINIGLGPNGTNAFGVNPRVDPITGRALDDHEVYSDRNDGEIRVRGDGGTLTMNKTLGRVTLTSITSYLDGFFLNRVDGDGSIAPLLAIDFYADTREFSQDARLSTNLDGPFNFIAGVYYQRDRVAIRTDWNFFAGALLRFQTYEQVRSSVAGYADGTFKFTDKAELYAGIRYTKDQGRLENFQVLGAGAPIIPLQPTKRYNNSAPTGRIGFNYKFTPDILGYIQYSRGYRSSAFNGSPLFNPNDLNVSRPEYLDSYEGGFKMQAFDRRLTFNVSGFYYNYKDQQFINTVSIGQSNVVNAGRAQFYGEEMELTAQVTPQLVLRAGASVLHAEYKQLLLNSQCTIRLQQLGSCTAAQNGQLIVENLRGKRPIEAPEATLNGAIDWTVPVGGNDDAVLAHIDANYVGAEFYDTRNDPLSRIGAYAEANARLAYRHGPLEVGAWVKNLTQNDKPGGISGSPDFTTFLQIFRTPVYPRRYGLDASFRF